MADLHLYRRPAFLPPPSGTVATAVVARMPARVRPYLRLMRLQGPIGTWRHAPEIED